MRKIKALAAAACLAFAATQGHAIINLPVPDNATITFGGLQWAWASPLGAYSVDLTYQGTLGWRLPTAIELASAPTALDFLFPGGNVPLGGSDPVSGAFFSFTDSTLNSAAALATPYFSDSYLHGDWCNGVGSACGYGEVAWNGNSYGESLVVRELAAVPEAAGWMMIAGFGLTGAALRRRRTTLRFA